MSISGSSELTWPVSKHSCSGLIPIRFIASSSSMISSMWFSKTNLKTKSLREREYLA